MATDTNTVHNVPAARAEAEAAKRQLMGTLHELQHRLKPSTIAHDAWSGVKDSATSRSDQARTMVKEKPQLAGAAAAALVLFFARKPLWSLLSKPFGHDSDDHLTTDLAKADPHVDLKAPVIPKDGLMPDKQGVNA